MARWTPDTRDRLVQAALELYTERGYDAVTVGDIADRVGVTARTYFRYFPDKREVLFATEQPIRDAIVSGTAAAIGSHPPFEAVLRGVSASAEVFKSREYALVREAIVVTSPELQERELMKLEGIAAELERLLVEAGSAPVVARMAADAGLSVFTEASRRRQDGDDASFETLVAQAARLLRDTVVV